MLKKVMSLVLALIMTLAIGMNAFAASNNIQAEAINSVLDDIIEYSTYDYETGTWELDYAIVEDGLLTVEQYNEAEVVGDYYKELFADNRASQTRALPVAVVVVLKAVAAVVGSTIAAEIAQDIYQFGMTAACENFSDIDIFYEFCSANDYI